MKAFPAYEWNENHKQIMSVSGMDLRDYFAAKAMEGFLYAYRVGDRINGKNFAESAYKMADEMMKVREK